MGPREEREALERLMLSPLASLAEKSKGRERNEPQCDIRTCYQRDIDRITHSNAFRRLKHKTQVFLQPEGDHYRTRLTHTLEVARIGRTIARALRLNEDLAEAIALGHDLGHTPFGHAGERALNAIIDKEGGFRHNEQSLRVVDVLERDGTGLNLSFEVRDGILCHTGEQKPITLEGSVIRIADRIAYINHDVDDAIRAGILRELDIPEEISCALGAKHGERINALILDMINESNKNGEIAMSPQIAFIFNAFYDFVYKNIYKNMRAKSEETKVFGIIDGLFSHYTANPDELPDDYRRVAMRDGLRRAVSDFVSGMTDKYSIYKYGELYVPAAWQVR
ncbi:MAG: deoxyguanosinetriphosphate triphosphohydrolase [Oscillospiraceae bacterium]|nr:deoxyguanosinetriphosphate triphosphohydrolase [Oscillospiraceae bacterium]